MDRFRFRVWSFQQKRMYYWNEIINMTNSCYALFVDNRELGEGLWDIQQSTGLKDKNGTLIYEGDVLRRDKNGHIIKIIYYQGGFGWMTNYNLFIGFAGHLYIEEILQCYEIIGNVHEMEVENE